MNLKFTNPSTEATVVVDVNPSYRDGRYARFTIAPDTAVSIDEADIKPVDSDRSDINSLSASLRTGILTITESDLDDVVDLKVKNWLADGLDLKYFTLSESVSAKDIVVLDTEENTVGYATTEGDKPLGVMRAGGDATHYRRVKIAGLATVVAAEAIVEGDKVGTDDAGQAVVVGKGSWTIGVADNDATTGEDVTLTIEIAKL